MGSHFKFETRLRGAFGLATFVLVALAAGVWYAHREAFQLVHSVARTHEVLEQLAETKASALLIELNIQNFRLTGDPAHLAVSAAAVASRENSLRQIKELTADNPRQQKQWAQLRAAVDERLAISERTDLLRRTENGAAAIAYLADAPLQATRERLFGIMVAMEEEERRLLEQRDALEKRVQGFRNTLGTITSFLLAVLLAVTFVMIRRQFAERTQVEVALQESEESLAATLHSIGDAVLATDTGRRITRMNPVAEQLTGWLLAEARGRPVEEVFHIVDEQTRTPAEVPVAKVLATGQGQGLAKVLATGRGQVLADQRVLIARDGTEWPIADSAAPIRDAVGQVGGVVLVFRDVTEERRAAQALQQLNESLEEANRAKSDFLANMSHELRTPLNSIIGFSEMLKDGVLGDLDVKQRGFVGDIFDAGTHLLSLINDILDLSKVEAGMLALEVGAVDVTALLESSLSVVREKALAHRIRLDTRLDPALGAMLADERKVKQIVYNLLANAVKFSPEGGTVTLAARRCLRSEVAFDASMPARLIALPPGDDAEFLEIEVADGGVGIAESHLGKLFEPFTQVDSSVARRHTGSGLGLSLVRRLAELHGGTVGVASRPGVGSRFCVWLPWRAVFALVERTRAAETANATRPALALVIEDDDRIADLIATQLRADGFTVMRAATAEEGLVRAAKSRPDLITLDIFLPSMDGWEFMRRLKADPQLADTPVVIITVSEDLGRGLALGARRVLQKPFVRGELAAAVAGLVAARPDGETQCVLVVDDNVQTVDLVAAILQGEGYRVLRAYSGAEAIEAVSRNLPDLVILDLIMPGMSGFEVARALRDAEQTARIPILVLTAKDLAVAEREILNSYVSAILAKADFNRTALLVELRRALPKRAGA